MSPNDFTLIQAIERLAHNGYHVLRDPSPELPHAGFYVLRNGQLIRQGLTGASVRMLAAYGVS